MRKFISALLLALLFIPMSAQLNLPIRKIGDKEYYYRQVKKKETIYGISKELGISKEDIIKYNPSVASGLKKDQWLYFPVDEFSKKSSKGSTAKQHIHIVKDGETLYGLSRTYNISISDLKECNPALKDGLKSGSQIIIPIKTTSENKKASPTPYIIKKGETLYRVALNNNTTIEAILEANPGISPTNFKAGETILIPASPAENKQDKQPETVFIAEKVKKGDSYESIAEKHDVSADELKEANPQTEKPKKGSYIYIPITQEPDTLTKNEIVETYNSIHKLDKSDTISVSIVLPFDSKDGKQAQKGQLYKDFYGGFLMAMNDFADKEDYNIKLSVFDSAEKTVESILSNSELKESDIIFISGNEAGIKTAGEFGEKYGINIVNAFSVNDDNFYDNERIFQLNTPSSYMYAALQNAVNDKFSDYRMVFISDDNDDNDKALIEHLKNTDLPRQTITITELSEPETFKVLVPDGQKILFVPTQSNKAFLKALKPALQTLKKDYPEYRFSLLGYPEWENYNGYKTFFHDMDTYLYSRYSYTGNENFVSDFNNKYAYWYGQKPLKSIPSMSILGYDMAMFFIPAIQSNGNDFNHGSNDKEGIESCISLKRVSNWGGFVNTSIFLINYKPDNTTTRTIIK